MYLKKRGLEDLFILTKYILGYKELDIKVHGDLCRHIQHTPGRLLILEPRDTFKTTCCSVGYSMFLILNNPDIRILLNHKTLTKSKEICGEIREHFEHNPLFRELYGDWKGETWGDKGIVVNRRTKVVREPTLTPGGVDHEITSSHYEVIISDDLAGLKDMVSLAEREKVLRYYKSLKFLRDKGRFIKEVNIGTRWHINDVASYLIGLKDFNIRIKTALLEDGSSYFPSRYTVAELVAEREEDPIMFESQRMNNPVSIMNQLYNIDDLNIFEIAEHKLGYCIAYVDPAFGRNEKGEPCYFSFPIASVHGTDIYIIDWETNRLTPEVNEQLIVAKIQEHNIRELWIESNVAQSEFIRNVQRTLKENGIGLVINGVNNTGNKDRRIQAMHGTVKNNVYFRGDWEKSYPEPMRQLLLYPQHKYKDAPDALAGLTAAVSGRKKEPRVRFV